MILFTLTYDRSASPSVSFLCTPLWVSKLSLPTEDITFSIIYVLSFSFLFFLTKSSKHGSVSAEWKYLSNSYTVFLDESYFSSFRWFSHVWSSKPVRSLFGDRFLIFHVELSVIMFFRVWKKVRKIIIHFKKIRPYSCWLYPYFR